MEIIDITEGAMPIQSREVYHSFGTEWGYKLTCQINYKPTVDISFLDFVLNELEIYKKIYVHALLMTKNIIDSSLLWSFGIWNLKCNSI